LFNPFIGCGIFCPRTSAKFSNASLGILRDPSHGKAIQDDLRIGLSTLPEWLQEVVRDLLKRSSDASQTPNQASAAEGMPY
jgi:hypothetical protein